MDMTFPLLELAEEVRNCLSGRDTTALSDNLYMGADGTMTKAIDELAEEAVISKVRELDLPCNILSEEKGLVDRGHDRTLVMDPIDGTYNAVHGIPFYAVSLAIASDDLRTVEEGLVMNLVTGDVYEAVKGGGSFKNGKQLKANAWREKGRVFSVTLGKLSTLQSLDVSLHTKRVRNLGSAALETCMVGEGALDMYYNSRPEGSLRIIDIAAAMLVLEEAGGSMLGVDLDPLNMPLDVKHRADVIAVCDLKYLELFNKKEEGHEVRNSGQPVH